MVALNATIVVRGQTGERRIAAGEFFTGIYETALSAQELLIAVEVPVAQKNSAHFFHEFARRHGDYAIAGLAAQAIVQGGLFTDLRAAFFAVGDRPILAKAATKLINIRITPAILAEASATLGEELDPQEDQQDIFGALRLRASWPSRRRGTGVTAALPISLEVNGEPVDAHVLPRLNLADFLREHLKLTGTHVGCEHGVCGACTVRVNGEIVRSCLMLAVQTHGASVVTIEGLSDSGEIADLQVAFRDRNALQCGFCTPGMLVAAQDLLQQETEPDREKIREHLSGNYCRCTGYQAIVDAVETTARARMGRKP
jgi:carbon-monoxide dehydrogenase small subunit